ncbi:MAG: ABC transporter permease [Clostridium sp.]|nr:ABC transporter permease [Clostridium sp.]
MSKIIYRNVSLYFRDKASVFFSLLSVLIVMLLYILFLSNVQVVSITEQIGATANKNNISYLINTWILAGILSITTVTSTLGALAFMVNDRENKIIKDFKSSPITNSTYPVAGVISSFIVGLTMSIIALLIYGVYIFIDTGYLFSLIIIVETLALIVVSTIMNAALMGLLVSFISTNNVYSSASLIIGTTIGFVNGLYIPIGELPDKIQTFIKLLPFAHIASMFRQILMKDSIPKTFDGAPVEAINTYKEIFGIILKWKNESIAFNISLIFVIAVFTISIILFFINFRRKREEI